MDILPKTKGDWGRLPFFVARVFVLLALISSEVFGSALARHGGCFPFLLFIVLGFTASFFVFLIGGIIQLATRRGAEAGLNLLCAFATLLIWLYILRHSLST
jgi:hypothetical protein